jgi:hypothetical protein
MLRTLLAASFRRDASGAAPNGGWEGQGVTTKKSNALKATAQPGTANASAKTHSLVNSCRAAHSSGQGRVADRGRVSIFSCEVLDPLVPLSA